MASLSLNIIEALIATAGLALTAVVWWAFAQRPRSVSEPVDRTERRVHVHGGYDPPLIVDPPRREKAAR